MYRHGYNNDISFYRPDGSTERKSIQWCINNDFYQVEEGLWSGDWYYKRFPEEKLRKEEKEKERLKKEKERLNRDPSEVVREYKRERYETRHAELLDEICDGCCYGDADGAAASTTRARQKLANLERDFTASTTNRWEQSANFFDQHFTPRTRKKSANLLREKYDFVCPLQGCLSDFRTDALLKEHVRTQTGKGHCGYRKRHNIAFCSVVPSSKKRYRPLDPTLKKRPRSVTTCVKSSSPRKQTDIRAFFQVTTK